MKNTGYNMQEMRTEIDSMAQISEAINKSHDVSGSMVKLHKTMDRVQPLIGKQTQYIKNFFQSQHTTDDTSK